MARRIGGRYTVREFLGQGVRGAVWRADSPDGPVAVKLLHGDFGEERELLAHFARDRDRLALLDHPGLVRVHDLVTAGTELALVTEFVEGESLRRLIQRRGSLAPAEAAAIVADAADALAAAHSAGLTHQDVKPENILLDRAGGRARARLTDLGTARLVDPGRAGAGHIVGTPAYLAPEVVEGMPPTAAVDVYALATTFYEMLAGMTPFGEALDGQVLRRHVTDSVPEIRGLPEPVATTLRSCLAKAPAARLTAGELAARLRDLEPSLAGLAPVTVAATPVGVGNGRPWRAETTVVRVDAPPTGIPGPTAPGHRERRRRALVIALGATLLLMVVLLWGAFG